MSKEDLDKAVEPLLEKLGEFSDAIQIMCTWNEDGVTHRYFIGSGNWYARQGLAHAFIDTDQAQITADEIGKVIDRE